MGENWRIEQDASDYFLHDRKKNTVADRRPVPRRAADLVGPGIDYAAVRISNFNDPLAFFNGYFSATAGTLNAPTQTEAFIGTVSGDAALGGIQSFTGLTTNHKYERTFLRNPSDPDSITYSGWKQTFWGNDTDWITAILGNGWLHFDARSVQYKRERGWLYMRGIARSGSGAITAFPAGFRPDSRISSGQEQIMSVVSNSAFGCVCITGSTGVLDPVSLSNAYVDFSQVSWKIAA